MKVLFVGLGGIGQRHLRNIKTLLGDNVDIYAFRQRKSQFVLDNKLNIKQDLSLDEFYNIKNVASLDAAFKENIDIVFITNPTSMHMEILLKAAENKCDIFVEKPLSHNLENISELEDVLNKNNNITFVGYQNRFHPCIKECKRLLEADAVGSIVSVNVEVGENIKTWHKYEDYRIMYASRADLGGGVVLSQIHELDYINSFFGMPKSVYAIGGKLSDLEIDVEDVSSALLNYEIDNKNVPIHIHQDYIQSPPSRGCKIIGTKGRLEFDLLKSTLVHYDEDGNEMLNKVYEFERNDMFMEELTLFLKSVKERKKTMIPIGDGIKSLKMAMAIKKSIKTGNLIKIDEI